MSLTILDRALIIAQHELDAMRKGDVDNAISFFRERGALLNEAMYTKDEDNDDDYRMKLIALQGYHQTIHREGVKLLEDIKASLIKSKSSSKMIKGYAQTRTQARSEAQRAR